MKIAINVKVYQIVNKIIEEIINYSNSENVIIREWNEYYKGEQDETNFELRQSFMLESQLGRI